MLIPCNLSRQELNLASCMGKAAILHANLHAKYVLLIHSKLDGVTVFRDDQNS